MSKNEIISCFKKNAISNNFFARILKYNTNLFDILAAKNFKNEQELLATFSC